MSILIALVPALAWGSVGIVTTKAGGTAAQGIMGMTIGAILLGFGTLAFFVIPNAGMDYAFNSRIWLVGFISGLIWAVGQVGQLIGFKKLGGVDWKSVIDIWSNCWKCLDGSCSAG